MKRQAMLLTAVALLVTIAVGEAVQARTPPVGKNGRIVFRRYLDIPRTNGAIFTMNPDGTKVAQVTFPRAGVNDTEPDWSPDAKKLAFERQTECPAAGPKNGLNNVCALVYTATRDGTSLKQLVPCGFKAFAPFPGNCVGVGQPAWSADGRRLAFQYNLTDRRYVGSLKTNVGIWIVDANGRHARQLTQRTPANAWDFGPQWSPDGRSVVFFRLDLRTDTEAVFVIGSDGNGERRLTPKGLNAANPSWSPDGRWILFNAETENGEANLHVIRPDGSALMNLTNERPNGYRYLSAAFSPDGTRIVTSRTPGAGPEGAADIVVMRADGSSVRRLTRTRLWDSGVDWGSAPLK